MTEIDDVYADDPGLPVARQHAHLDEDGVLWLNGVRVPEWTAPVLPEEDGHLFRFTVEIKGRYKVRGHEGYFDQEEFGDEPWTIEVRAWSLDAALKKVRELGMNAWTIPGED